ncbi:MAG: hypothetical protein V4515_05460 [Chloroflexota bacterium]
MHRAHGEHGGDGETIEIETTVGDDDADGAASGGGHRFPGQSLERRFKAGRAIGGSPRCVELDEPAPAQGPDCREDRTDVGDHGTIESHAAGTARHTAQQWGPSPDVDPQVHHQSLALGIDGWVGHLREGLLQVVRGASIDTCQTGRRRVVAHTPERFLPVDGHGPDIKAKALGVESGEEAQALGRVRESRLVD